MPHNLSSVMFPGSVGPGLFFRGLGVCFYYRESNLLYIFLFMVVIHVFKDKKWRYSHVFKGKYCANLHVFKG